MKKGDVIGISATKGAAILGFPSYQTSFQVWQGWIEKIEPGINERLGFVMPEKPTGPALNWGLAFESAIIKLAEEKTDGDIIGREQLAFKGLFYPVKDAFSHDPKMLAYLDGNYKVIDNCMVHSPGVLHEGKTTSYYYYKDNFGEPGTDRIPLTYQAQCQHAMMCTGAKETILSVLVFPKRVEEFEEIGITVSQIMQSGERDWDIIFTDKNGDFIDAIYPERWATTLNQMGYFHQYPIKANPVFQDLMLQKYRTWWNDHIIRRTPPEPTSYDDFKRIIPEPVGTIILPEKPAGWYKEYKDIGKETSKTGVLGKAREQKKLLILEHARKMEPTLDDESTDKWIFMDETGKKLGSYNGKTFR